MDKDTAAAAIDWVRSFLADPFDRWSDVLTDVEGEALRLASRGLFMSEIGETQGVSKQAAHQRVNRGLTAIAGDGGPSLDVHQLPAWVQDEIRETLTDDE